MRMVFCSLFLISFLFFSFLLYSFSTSPGMIGRYFCCLMSSLATFLSLGVEMKEIVSSILIISYLLLPSII